MPLFFIETEPSSIVTPSAPPTSKLVVTFVAEGSPIVTAAVSLPLPDTSISFAVPATVAT